MRRGRKDGKKKVLHILNTSSYSGAENVAITIINNMTKDVECAYASMDGPIKNHLAENSVKFLPMRSMTILELRRIINLYKPDIIHAHDYTTSIVAASSGIKTTIISHLHNNSPWIKAYHPYSFIYLLSTLRYKSIIGVSDSIFKEYVFGKMIANKTKVVSNPIKTEDVSSKALRTKSSSPKYDIVFVGRLVEPKNPLRFLEIMKNIIVKFPDIRIAIIGEGYLRKDCENKIIELKLINNVDMLGFISNPYGIIANSKMLCMTSTWEGFGLVAIEALTLGKPVICTPVGGLPKIVDNKCGLLTESNKKYENEIIKLMKNKEYWNIKSLNGIKKSKNMNNIQVYIENLNNIYFK